MYTFAIIGCGAVARQHAEAIQGTGKLVAVCDSTPSKADQFARDHQAKAYYSIEDLLLAETGLDVVCVCTPNGYHAEHSIKSLQSGKNVISEFPFCLTKAGAWQTIETEKFCRKRLFVVNPVHDTELKALKQRIEDRSPHTVTLKCAAPLSDEYRDWRGKIFPGGGALYTAFSPYIEIILFLFGDLLEATAAIDRKNGSAMEIEDGGAATLTMQSGVKIQLEWSMGAEEEARLLLEWEDVRQEFLLGTGDSTVYRRFYDQLPAALEGGPHSLATLYEAARTVEAIEKIYKELSPNHPPQP